MGLRSLRALPVLFLLLVLATATYAQTATLRGFVTDAVKEQPLQLASVVIENEDGTQLGAVTDGDGYFIIRRIPAGTYALRVSYIGYRTYEEAVDISESITISRSIVLEPEEEELDEVVVESETETGISSVVAGLETMIPAQVERVPIIGVTGDLASYLQTVPGVTVTGDRGGQFFVRGGSVDQNLALLDGMPVYMPFHVLSFYSAFPEETMDHADFYTGGFGARYGNRISSILDVRTRNGNKQNLAGSVSVAPFLSTARIEGPLVKDRVSIIASGRHSLIEDIVPNMLGQALPYQFGDLFGKLHAFITPNHSLSFTGLHTYDRGDIAGTLKTFDGETLPRTPNDSSEIAWTNTVYGGTYTYLSDTLPVLARLSANRSEMDNEMGPRDARDRTSGIESQDIAADFTLFLGDLDLNVGVMERNSTLSYELGGQFQGLPEVNEADLKEQNAYLEADLSLQNGLLRLTPGLHVYRLPDRDQHWLDPRGRISWTPALFKSRVQFNASGGLYHQAIVGLNDERDVGNLFTVWVPVDEDAPVPSSVHAILGANVQVRPWLSVAAEGFLKSFENLSVPVFSDSPSFTTALQQADGEAVGLDLRLDVLNRPFWYESEINGFVSYSLSKVTYETANFSYPPGHDRRHQVNALITAEKNDISLTVQVQYGTGLPFTESSGFDVWLLLTPDVDVASEPGRERIAYGAPFEGRQPDYQRVDFWIERRIDRGRSVVTLRAGAINVFNRDNLFYYDLFEFRRVDQLPFIPSVGLKIELR